MSLVRSGAIPGAMRCFNLDPRGSGHVSVWALVALATLWVAGCDGEQDPCTQGYEACECTADARCLEGLQCLSDRCVDPNGPANASDSGGSSKTGDSSGADGAFDNTAACEALLDSLECAPPGGVALIDCASLGVATCDIADYFDCLADNTTCTGGQLDPSGWTQCMDLAVCT